jgi:hypothetical protein
MPRSVEEVE